MFNVKMIQVISNWGFGSLVNQLNWLLARRFTKMFGCSFRLLQILDCMHTIVVKLNNITVRVDFSNPKFN